MADARATRRKERRRLQREHELALNGRKETKSGKKAIPQDLVKAARLKHQLDHWFDIDPEQGHEATKLWGSSTGSADVDAAAVDHLCEDQHSYYAKGGAVPRHTCAFWTLETRHTCRCISMTSVCDPATPGWAVLGRGLVTNRAKWSPLF